MKSLSTRSSLYEAVLAEARWGLRNSPKTLAPWLFYDDLGSLLFERITQLPEYYITRTERAILEEAADEIIYLSGSGERTLTIVELGAGSGDKTGLLLDAALRYQGIILYRPIDVSESALSKAKQVLRETKPGVHIHYQVADYTREAISIDRTDGSRILALYIGSSIGNFTPPEAKAVLVNLRAQLLPGDMLLLGTDLAPGANKKVEDILNAYDDADGVTSAFNLNVLERLNRDLGANFSVQHFRHRAVWNERECRIELHLDSTRSQVVFIPGLGLVDFEEGESIQTENSYKFSVKSIADLLSSASFAPTQSWSDREKLFLLTLGIAR